MNKTKKELEKELKKAKQNVKEIEQELNILVNQTPKNYPPEHWTEL
jgi:hypothetical protein